MKRYLGKIRPEVGRLPEDTNAAVPTDWVSFESYDSVIVQILADDGGSGDDIVITPQQATDNSGTGAKGVTPRDYYRKRVSGNVDASGRPVRVDGAATYTIDGDSSEMLLFEITADEMDVNGGFNFFRVNTDAGGSTGKFLSTTFIFCGARYATSPDEWPAVNA